MRATATGQRGFTMIELTIVVALLSLSVATVTGVFKTSSDLAADSRAVLRVHEEHRRNVEAIATRLRGAAVESLTGFVSGTSTNPHFVCVTGAGKDALVTGGPEELCWVPSPTPVRDVGVVGTVQHVTLAGSTLVANRVPKDGFLVRQDGDNLIVRLTTYYQTSQNRTAVLTSETAVFARN